ncbi:TRAP transporter small permease [Taklimakanibacter deserti]|uniref:TRAP transporter small permease n=1 Tax=Taklimakanibacter deserti TaxID=2267839 RepID=UPI000E64905E
MERWILRWKSFAELMAAAMFATMFLAFMAQILSRYVFNVPLSWTLEVCSIAYIWVIFWSCDILLSERQHIIFDVLYKKFPPRPRRWVAIANTAAIGLTFLAALPGILDYIAFLGRRHTMVLHVPFDIVYSCFGIFMIAAIVGAALRLRRLLSSSWKQNL